MRSDFKKGVVFMKSVESSEALITPRNCSSYRDQKKELDIMGENNKVEILARGNEILMKKYAPPVFFCHETDDLIEFNGQKICKDCAQKIGEATK